MPPILTIAIPTYNRASKLAGVLDALAGQIRDSGLQERVALLISDNCSTDATPEALRRFAEANKDLGFTHHRQDQNVGIAKNLWWLYEQSRTEYCWYFADDDVLAPGAVAKIASALEMSAPRVLLFSFEQPPGSKIRTFDYPDPVSLFTDPETIASLIVRWPKISIYVYRKAPFSRESMARIRETLAEHGYIHLVLALCLFHDNPGGELAVISEQLAACDEDFRILRTPANDWAILHRVFEHPYIRKHAPLLSSQNGPRQSYYNQINFFWAWKSAALRIDASFLAEYETALARLPLRWDWLLRSPKAMARALIMKTGIPDAPLAVNRMSTAMKRSLGLR